MSRPSDAGIDLLNLPDRIIARFAAYGIAGVANATVGVTAILVAGALGANAVPANAIGYGLGLIVSFTLNSRITFRGRKSNWVTALRFLAGFLVAFGVNVGIVIGAGHVPQLPKAIASLAGTPAYVILFFLICEYWVFRKTRAVGGEGTGSIKDVPR